LLRHSSYFQHSEEVLTSSFCCSFHFRHNEGSISLIVIYNNILYIVMYLIMYYLIYVQADSCGF
jgi:hypothetical protein